MRNLSLLFYGNTFVPLSSDCNGCHFFNYECPGSVYHEFCPIGMVENMEDTQIALSILQDEKVSFNHFVLARVNGIEKTVLLDQEKDLRENLRLCNTISNYSIGLEKALDNIKIAYQLEDEAIKDLQEKYLPC